jgi:hypothetical protein
LTWEAVRAGEGGPLAFLYLAIVRELAELRAQLQPIADLAPVDPRAYLPDRIPPSTWLAQALRQARQSLQELQVLLAQS